MTDIVSLAIKVATTEVNRANTELGKLQNELSKTESVAFKVGFAIGETFKIAAKAAIGLAAGVGTLTLAFGKQIDDLNDLGEMYGYNATEVLALKNAAQDAGGTFEGLVTTYQKARKELALGGQAYKNLGIDLRKTNGDLKTSAELAAEVAKKYTDGNTTAQQFADVQKVLGKDTDKAAATVNSAAKAQKFLNEMTDAGIGLVQGSKQATDDFSDAKQRASIVMNSLGSILVAKVLPAFTVLTNALVDSYKEGGFVKVVFQGIIDILPFLVDGAGLAAKGIAYIATAFRLAGTSIGFFAAAMTAVLTGNGSQVGAMREEYHANIRGIIDDNGKWQKSIEETTTKAQTALAKADLSLPKPGGGRGKKTDPTPTGAPEQGPKESNAVSELLSQEKAIIALQQAYQGLFIDESRTKELQLEAAIDAGKYKTVIDEATGKVKQLGASEDQLNQMRANAKNEDYLAFLNKITKAQIDSDEVIKKAQQSAKDEIEVNRIRVNVLKDYSKTEDDVRVATAQYLLTQAEAKLASAEEAKAKEDVLIKLREEVALKRALLNAEQAKTTDNKAETERQQTFQYGWQKAFDEYKKAATDASKTAGDIFNSVMGNSEAAVERLLTTGKLGFKDFARSILSDMAKIIAKQMVLRAIGFMFGGGFQASFSQTALGASGFGSGLAYGNQDLALGLATGTNYVPYDNFPAYLHKGEAVVPAKYNPAADGDKANGVNIGSINVTVQGGQTNAETGTIVAQSIRKEMMSIADAAVAKSWNYGGISYNKSR